MIDLHTHTLFSDGVLLPSELVRRAEAKGYRAIALTDHVDASNIDFVIPRIVNVCKVLNKYWKIKVIPGVEITHSPLEDIQRLVRFARKNHAKIIVGHGETVTEPVLKGTNRAFINARVDILAHPGKITSEDVKLAKAKNVYLEITTRKGHSITNKHVIAMAQKYGAPLVLDTDSHAPDNLITSHIRDKFLSSLNINKKDISCIIENSVKLTKF
jgi:putative hydrolase